MWIDYISILNNIFNFTLWCKTAKIINEVHAYGYSTVYGEVKLEIELKWGL